MTDDYYFKTPDEKGIITQYLQIDGALETSRYIIEALCHHLQEECQEEKPAGKDLIEFIDMIQSFSPAFLPLYSLQNYRNYIEISVKEIIESLKISIRQISHSISGFGVNERHLSLYGVNKRVLVLGFPPQIAELMTSIGGIEEVRIIIPPNLSKNNKRVLTNRVDKYKREISNKEIFIADSSDMEGEVAKAHNIFLETWGVVKKSLQGFVVYLPDQAGALLKEASISRTRVYGVASETLQFKEKDILLDGIARHLSFFSGVIMEDSLLHTSKSNNWEVIKDRV